MIAAGEVAHFGYPGAEAVAAADASVCCDCSTTAWVDVRGVDAEAFLHAQFSNDVRHLGPDRWQPNAYCNPKGRVIALPGLVRSGAGFRMAVHRSLLSSLLRRLRMYVLRAKVELASMADIVNIGLAGPLAGRMVGEHWPDFGDAPFAAWWSGETLLRRFPHGRVMISTTPNIARDLWHRFSESLGPAGEPRWAWLDIKCGWPNVGSALSEQHIPQALNLDRLDMVSFHKGCYPGQEIVARVHYLGRVKQRMLQGRIEAQSEVVVPGAAIYADDHPVGDIVDARPGPDGLLDALAILPQPPDGAYRVGAADGPAFIVS